MSVFVLPSLDDPAVAQRPATAGYRAFDALRRAIVQLRLLPGNPLSEAEVARQFGISRQPVREAFIKLAEVGLVEIRPQRGTFVKLISMREVENARFVREAIEVAIASKASREAAASAGDALRALIERQREASRSGDHVAFLELDETFHQQIAIAADCDHAWRVLEGLKAQMDRVRYLSMPQATPIETLIAQHDAIAAAISEGRPAAAEAAMRAHLSEILTSLPILAGLHPELFSP